MHMKHFIFNEGHKHIMDSSNIESSIFSVMFISLGEFDRFSMCRLLTFTSTTSFSTSRNSWSSCAEMHSIKMFFFKKNSKIRLQWKVFIENRCRIKNPFSESYWFLHLFNNWFAIITIFIFILVFNTYLN